jgi:3-oxoacyl-[acyl-carrier protein] reductase
MSRALIITGTSKGLGKYLAELYLERGCRVAGCSRSSSPIEHDDYMHYSLDVADERAVTDMVRDVARKWKEIDILINNAGTASMNHTILTPLSVVKNVMNTNFIGTFIFTREVAKIMINRKAGRIINISTVAVPLSLEGESIYVASKSAVESFTKVLARELAPYNITVNAVGAAPLMTALVKAVPKEKIDKILHAMAIPRFAEFRDVSNVVDFFIKEESDFITGQILYLGGV